MLGKGEETIVEDYGRYAMKAIPSYRDVHKHIGKEYKHCVNIKDVVYDLDMAHVIMEKLEPIGGVEGALIPFLKHSFNDVSYLEKNYKYVDWEYSKSVQIISAFVEGAKELGVDRLDIHIDNVMFDPINDRFKIIDFF